MRQIRWTTAAADQFEAAVKHVQQDNPTAASDVALAVIDRIEQLAAFPGLGRPGEVRGTRELVSPSGTARKTGAEPAWVRYGHR